MSRAEERALEAYPTIEQAVFDEMYPRLLFTRNTERSAFVKGYEQAEKDIKEAIIKHFKYKQDHSPEHTLHWWVYKNVIDKINEL